jgi:hypothetical protein
MLWSILADDWRLQRLRLNEPAFTN